MKKTSLFLTAAMMLVVLRCGQAPKNSDASVYAGQPVSEFISISETNAITPSKTPEDLLSAGDEILEKITGDLNGDGIDDVVIFTKQTIHEDDWYGNRRGIYIAFKKGEFYELAAVMPGCFGSRGDSGPITIEIKEGKLYIHEIFSSFVNHNWTFRYQNNNFELIGFDAYDRETKFYERFNTNLMTETTASINFLTKKVVVKTVIWEEDLNEVFNEEERIWDILLETLVKLTDIKQFDVFDIGKHYSE